MRMASMSSSPEDDLLGPNGIAGKFPVKLYTLGAAEGRSEPCGHKAGTCLCFDYITHIPREDQTQVYSEPVPVRKQPTKNSKKFSLADYKERKKLEASKVADNASGTPNGDSKMDTPSPGATASDQKRNGTAFTGPPPIRINSPPYMGPAPRDASTAEKRSAPVFAEKYELMPSSISPPEPPPKRVKRDNTPPPSPPRKEKPMASQTIESRPKPKEKPALRPSTPSTLPPKPKAAPPRTRTPEPAPRARSPEPVQRTKSPKPAPRTKSPKPVARKRSPEPALGRLSPGLPSVVEEALESVEDRAAEEDKIPLSPTLPPVVEAALAELAELEEEEEKEKEREKKRVEKESPVKKKEREKERDGEFQKAVREGRELKEAKPTATKSLSKDSKVEREDAELKKGRKSLGSSTATRPASSSSASKTIKKERSGSESPMRRSTPKTKSETASKTTKDYEPSKLKDTPTKDSKLKVKKDARPARSPSEEPMRRSTESRASKPASKSIGPKSLLAKIAYPPKVGREIQRILARPSSSDLLDVPKAKAGKRPHPSEKEGDFAPPPSKKAKTSDVATKTPASGKLGSTPRPGTSDGFVTPQSKIKREDVKVETPGSIKGDSRPASSSQQPAKGLPEEKNRFLHFGTRLKHDAEGKGKTREEIEAINPKVALVKLVDAVLCFMIAYAADEAHNPHFSRQSRQWQSILPFADAVAKRAMGMPEGRALGGLVNSLRAWVLQHIIDGNNQLVDRTIRAELDNPSRTTLERIRTDLTIPLRDLAEARAAAQQHFNLEVVIEQFPKTWAERTRSLERIPQNPRIEPGCYRSEYMLPLSVGSNVLEAINIGYSVLAEWAGRHKVKFEKRI